MSAVRLWEEQSCCLLYRARDWPAYLSTVGLGTWEMRWSLCPTDTVTPLPAAPWLSSWHRGSTCAFQSLLKLALGTRLCPDFAPARGAHSHGFGISLSPRTTQHRKEEYLVVLCICQSAERLCIYTVCPADSVCTFSIFVQRHLQHREALGPRGFQYF